MISSRRAFHRPIGKGQAGRAETGGGGEAGMASGLSNQLLQRLGRARAPEEAQADRIAESAVRGEAPPAPARGAPGWDAAPSFRNPGRPLDRTTRERFAPHFPGLGEVRIHDDAEGARAAAALGARAFTAGRDIAFGPGRYAPGTGAGARLLAHELAHVAQGGEFVRRQPLDEGETEESLPPVGPQSLLSMDYWGPQACGGAECFTDEKLAEILERNQLALVGEATMAQVAEPIGQIGRFHVSVGPLLDQPRPSPAAAAAGTGRIQSPPLPAKVIAQGDRDSTVARAAWDMAGQTRQPIVGLGKGSLAGVEEVTLVAHGNLEVVVIDGQELDARQLARRLYDAGWRGRTLRFASCETGVAIDLPALVQSTVNELAALGVESAGIGPRSSAYVTSTARLPQVGPSEMQRPLLGLGKGWFYAVPEVPLGPPPVAVEAPLSGWHPGTWRGGALTAGTMGAMMVLSYFHNRALAGRVQEQVAETGFAHWGQGDVLDRLGDLIHDPLGLSFRSIPMCQRFDITRWRLHMAAIAGKKAVGETWEIAGEAYDRWTPLTPRPYTITYRKMPDGRWRTEGCDGCGEGHNLLDLNLVLDPLASDTEVDWSLGRPSSCEDHNLA